MTGLGEFRGVSEGEGELNGKTKADIVIKL